MTQTVADKNRGGLLHQWGGNIALFFTFTHFSQDLTVGLLVGLLPFIRQDLGLNYLQASFLVSVSAIVGGCAQLLGGWISDRISPKKAIALGLGGIGLGAVAISVAPSYYALLGILVAMGVLAGFYHPSAISAITNNLEERHRGRALALHMVGGNMGFAIGPFLGAAIAQALSWQVAFLILGLPALIAALLTIIRLKLTSPYGRPKDAAAGEKNVKRFAGIWQVFKTVGIIFVIVFGVQLVSGPVMSFLSLYLVDVHQLSAAAGSMWLTVVRVGGLVGSLAGGWLTDRWGRRKTLLLCLIAFGPVTLLLAKLPYGMALVVIFILFGWFMMMRETTMQTYLMDSSPPYLRATVTGIYFFVGQEGASLIQPLAGNLMDKVGIVGVYDVFAYIALGLSAFAVILALKKISPAHTAENN